MTDSAIIEAAKWLADAIRYYADKQVEVARIRANSEQRAHDKTKMF